MIPPIVLTGYLALGVWAVIGSYYQYRKSRERRKQFDAIQAEIEFMKPIFERLNMEALERWCSGDFQGYEKSRQQIIHLQARWKREVSDKITP